MTPVRRLLVIAAVAAALLVSTASAANAGSCRFIVDYYGNIVSVQCDKIA